SLIENPRLTNADIDPVGRGRSFGDIMKEIFLRTLPALIGAGILQGLTSVFVTVGLLREGTSLHLALTTISSGIFYFLPFLLAPATAKAFGTSPYLATSPRPLLGSVSAALTLPDDERASVAAIRRDPSGRGSIPTCGTR